MKKICSFITKKSLVRNLVLSLFAACIVISLLCYGLYYYNTSRILENRLAEQTRSQLSLNNQNMIKNFDTLETISDSLLNSLYQYDPETPLSYITRMNQLSTLRDPETIRFANYTINTLDSYLKNYPMLDSILLYTRNGTVIASTGIYTKTQIMQTESSDFIIDSIIPDFDPEIMSFLWLGGYDTREFIVSSSEHHSGSYTPSYVFTGIRRVQRYYNSQEDLFLVFNVRQEVIYDIYYTYPITSDVGSVFLMNSDGKIQFSNDESLIGTYSPYADDLTERNGFVSLTALKDGQKYNVFYQSIDNTDWFILYEIPTVTYASDITSVRNLSVLMFALTMIMLLFIIFYVLIRKLKPIQDLTQAATYIGEGKLGYTIDIQEKNEIGALAQNFNQMSLRLQQIMMEKDRIAEEKRRQEIAVLQAQINPHFILNTINTVKWMAIINHVPNISECLTSFGKILEPLLKQQTDFYTVADEISYLKNYVDTMNYSYGNTIRMAVSIPEELKKCKIPRFILQPLVENAVLHGVNKNTNEVSIEIMLSSGKGILCLAVYSQGTAIPPEQLLSIQNSLISMAPIPGSRTSSIGLTNIVQRIQLFYGESHGLWIENSSDCQVKVTVTLPLEYLA